MVYRNGEVHLGIACEGDYGFVVGFGAIFGHCVMTGHVWRQLCSWYPGMPEVDL